MLYQMPRLHLRARAQAVQRAQVFGGLLQGDHALHPATER